MCVSRPTSLHHTPSDRGPFKMPCIIDDCQPPTKPTAHHLLASIQIPYNMHLGQPAWGDHHQITCCLDNLHCNTASIKTNLGLPRTTHIKSYWTWPIFMLNLQNQHHSTLPLIEMVCVDQRWPLAPWQLPGSIGYNTDNILPYVLSIYTTTFIANRVLIWSCRWNKKGRPFVASSLLCPIDP